MLKDYKAILFDLDGTLLNTITDIQKAINVVEKNYGFKFSSQKDTMKLVGHGLRNSIKSIPGMNEDDVDDALEIFYQSYQEVYLQDSHPYEGIVDGLKSLKDKGIQLACISNKDDVYVQKLVENEFDEDTFAFVAGAKIGIPKKPDPQMLFNALSAMKLTPSECLFIGDTSADIQSAQRAGMDVMAVGWGFRDLESLMMFKPTFFAETVLDCFAFLGSV